jgi:hypothetical protein
MIFQIFKNYFMLRINLFPCILRFLIDGSNLGNYTGRTNYQIYTPVNINNLKKNN